MTRASRDRVRLQKFLSDAGVASRRRCEELIEEGRVLVNDEIIDTLPAFVDPQNDRVIADGAPVRVRPPEYLLVNKPKGVVCTRRDPSGRPRAVDIVPRELGHLFPVGRLDVDSCGLLLMTNDGELAERIAHPRYGIPKVYRVEVDGFVPQDLPATLRKGVFLSEGRASAEEVEVVHRSRQRSVLMLTLREGRNRQVRRMLARAGHKVRSLKRVQIGDLTIRGLPAGAWRRLSPGEIASLQKRVMERKPRPRKPGARRPKTAQGSRRARARARDSVSGKDEQRTRRRRVIE